MVPRRTQCNAFFCLIRRAALRHHPAHGCPKARRRRRRRRRPGCERLHPSLTRRRAAMRSVRQIAFLLHSRTEVQTKAHSASLHFFHSAIIQQPPCYKGDGPGCEASASENALIHKLLEQSRAKREQNDNTMLEKYWKQGYGDYFSYGFNKQLVRDQHGKWSLVDPDDVPSRVQRRIEQLMKRPK